MFFFVRNLWPRACRDVTYLGHSYSTHLAKSQYVSSSHMYAYAFLARMVTVLGPLKYCNGIMVGIEQTCRLSGLN